MHRAEGLWAQGQNLPEGVSSSQPHPGDPIPCTAHHSIGLLGTLLTAFSSRTAEPSGTNLQTRGCLSTTAGRTGQQLQGIALAGPSQESVNGPARQAGGCPTPNSL